MDGLPPLSTSPCRSCTWSENDHSFCFHIVFYCHWNLDNRLKNRMHGEVLLSRWLGIYPADQQRDGHHHRKLLVGILLVDIKGVGLDSTLVGTKSAPPPKLPQNGERHVPTIWTQIFILECNQPSWVRLTKALHMKGMNLMWWAAGEWDLTQRLDFFFTIGEASFVVHLMFCSHALLTSLE